MPKPTQPTSCHGLGRLGGTHPGLSGLQVLACLHHDACCQMGWLHAVRGHSSRLFKIFKICPIFQDQLSELSDMGAFQRALRGGWSKDSNPRVYTSFRAGWASLS